VKYPVPFVDHPLVDRFVPNSLRHTGKIEEVHSRILIASMLALLVWGPVFAVFHLVGDRPLLASVYLIASFVVGPAPFVFQRTGSLAMAANMVSLILWAVLAVVMLSTGGLESSGVFWLVIVPVFPYIFGLRRSFQFWLVVSLLTPVALWVAGGLGVEFPTRLSEGSMRLLRVISASAVILIVSQLFALNRGLQRWLSQQVRRKEDQRRQTEAELQEARHRALGRSLQSLQMLVRRMPEGVIVFRRGRIIQTNRAFREMIGVEEAEELLGTEAAQLLEGADRESVADFMARVERGEDVSYREFRLLGEQRDEPLVVEAFGFRGVHEQEQVGFLVLRDLTERRELQSKMMQMDRMIAVGTLAAGVAHEINNPLAYVHANVEYLLSQTRKYTHAEEGAEVEPEEWTEVLEDVREGTTRIRSIVADLSTFSASHEAESEPLDVEQILESTIKMAENQLRHRATLVRDYEEVPAVKGVESNLAQVFLNLLVNAAQAIPEGAVEDNEIRVSIHSAESEDAVVISITDTGSGIPEAVQARVFDPFFSTKSPDQGMGLGLSICRNLIHAQGGSIDFTTCDAEGTTFRVELPAVHKTASASQEFQPPRPSGEFSGRALVIDDEPQLGKTIQRALGQAYDTTIVTSGRRALEVLADDKEFAVIICDLLMPDVSGVDVFEQMQSLHPQLVERMVFITGGTFTEVTREFAETCQRPVLLKPFDVQALRELVDEVASGAHASALSSPESAT
jgi:PAS domain S-box-containing protein